VNASFSLSPKKKASHDHEMMGNEKRHTEEIASLSPPTGESARGGTITWLSGHMMGG